MQSLLTDSLTLCEYSQPVAVLRAMTLQDAFQKQTSPSNKRQGVQPVLNKRGMESVFSSDWEVPDLTGFSLGHDS